MGGLCQEKKNKGKKMERNYGERARLTEGIQSEKREIK